jgi:hypothetical protein
VVVRGRDCWKWNGQIIEARKTGGAQQDEAAAKKKTRLEAKTTAQIGTVEERTRTEGAAPHASGTLQS